jgi:outer membrane protease
VYPADTVAPLLSQLLWDIKPVLYNGMILEFSPAKPMEKWGFFASLALKYGIPGNSGIMEDRDWQSVENDALTNFSSHDNMSRELLLTDTAAGIHIPIESFILLKIYANISYMRFSFSGMDGYYIYARSLGGGKYAPIDDNPSSGPFSGKVINYTQQWMTLALGYSFDVNFLNNFSAGSFVLLSPLVICNGLDEHLLTKTQYNDYMRGGLFLEHGVDISFSPTQWLTLSLDCSWRYISGTRGASYYRKYYKNKDEDKFYIHEGEGGAGLSILNTSLRLKVRL